MSANTFIVNNDQDSVQVGCFGRIRAVQVCLRLFLLSYLTSTFEKPLSCFWEQCSVTLSLFLTFRGIKLIEFWFPLPHWLLRLKKAELCDLVFLSRRREMAQSHLLVQQGYQGTVCAIQSFPFQHLASILKWASLLLQLFLAFWGKKKKLSVICI